MRSAGFNFWTPEELGMELQRRIEGAGENLTKLKGEVLPYDIAVTKAQIDCFKSILPQAAAEYEKTHRTELRLIGEKEQEALDAMTVLECAEGDCL